MLKTVKENSAKNYRHEIVRAHNAIFNVCTEAVTDFDGDGVLNVWEIDEQGNPKQIIKD